MVHADFLQREQTNATITRSERLPTTNNNNAQKEKPPIIQRPLDKGKLKLDDLPTPLEQPSTSASTARTHKDTAVSRGI